MSQANFRAEKKEREVFCIFPPSPPWEFWEFVRNWASGACMHGFWFATAAQSTELEIGLRLPKRPRLFVFSHPPRRKLSAIKFSKRQIVSMIPKKRPLR